MRMKIPRLGLLLALATLLSVLGTLHLIRGIMKRGRNGEGHKRIAAAAAESGNLWPRRPEDDVIRMFRVKRNVFCADPKEKPKPRVVDHGNINHAAHPSINFFLK